MTTDECLATLKERGIEAELRGGIPFIPVSSLPDVLETKRILDVVNKEMNLGITMYSEGWILSPP